MMNKNELITLLKSVMGNAVNEGVSSDQNSEVYPRVVFWDYVWEDQVASGNNYNAVETYQISFYAKKPKDTKLLELRQALRDAGLHPVIYHEFIQEDKVFHSYFALEVIADE